MVRRLGGGLASTPGALTPVRVILSPTLTAYWPHPPHSQAHRDFADYATYTRCLRCAGAPRRPASGSGLLLPIPSRHAVPYVPGETRIALIQFLDSSMGLRRDPNGSALSLVLPSVSSRSRISGLTGSPLLRPVRSLAPPDGSDRELSRPPGAFTSRLSTGHVPRLDITTTVTGRLCRWDFPPLERQLASLHRIRT